MDNNVISNQNSNIESPNNFEPKIMEITAILNFPIERVYLFVTNFSLISFLSHSNFKVTKLAKSSSKLEDTDFEGYLEPGGAFKGSCLKCINYLSHKKFKTQLIFNRVIVVITKTLYKIQKNNSTLCYNKIKIRPNPNANETIDNNAFNFEEFQKMIKKTSYFLIKEANQFLSTSFLFLHQIESCVLKCKLEEAWEIISDINKFKEICPQIDITRDNLTFCDDGNKHIIKVRHNKGFAIMKLEMIKLYPKCKSCSYSMDLLWADPKTIPLQKISFIGNRITNSQTQLLFIHDFKEPINNEFINLCGNNKKAILKDLQKYFEKKSKEKESLKVK